jgi:3-dehydroquinate dehydratase/shikimate dehydrogenase
MICISIAQESCRFARVDMHNAAPQCDLLEVCLDRFGKAPDLGDLLENRPRPVIMCCRRPQDGGKWDGTEADRLAILRQCIIGKADYVEIELDAADQIRKFPPAKRVISYTNLHETPANVGEIYAQALTKSPDVVKLATITRTPEEAWPLLQILAKPAVPTVVVGIGAASVMLTVLGKRIGAPWTYAALETGMEAYPEQPTVRALHQVYHYGEIDRSTRFVGVTGSTSADRAAVAALNAGFVRLGLPLRCLPLAVGNVRIFRKVIDAVKLAAVVPGAADREAVREIATELDPAANEAHAVDLLLRSGEGWRGCFTAGSAALAALEAAMRERTGKEKPLQGRMAMVVGTSPSVAALVAALQERGAAVIVASRNREAAHRIAQEAGCRYVLYEALYSTAHDVLIVCDVEKHPGKGGGEAGIHAAYLKSGMAVLDLTSPLEESPLVREALQRGCAVVTPRQLFLGQLQSHAAIICGREVPAEPLEEALGQWSADAS